MWVVFFYLILQFFLTILIQVIVQVVIHILIHRLVIHTIDDFFDVGFKQFLAVHWKSEIMMTIMDRK